MNVAELKQELAKYPDDWRIAVSDPTEYAPTELTAEDVSHCLAGAVHIGYARMGDDHRRP